MGLFFAVKRDLKGNNFGSAAKETKGRTDGRTPLLRHWDVLNHIYGVVEIIRDLTKDLKVVLAFEPGLYSHTQVKDNQTVHF